MKYVDINHQHYTFLQHDEFLFSTVFKFIYYLYEILGA